MEIDSQTLFNIYINELTAALETTSVPGLALHDTLLYADHCLLLSPTERCLKASLKMLEKYSETWALPINPPP